MTKKFNGPAYSAKQKTSGADELRRLAENDPRSVVDVNSPEISDAGTAHLIHELRVQQIELEMQNEALREAQFELQRMQAQYFELYELAPVGYLTLNEKGLILESNLTASKLLGVKKGALAKRPLSQFIVREHLDVYYFCFRRLLADGHNDTCELCMSGSEGNKFWVALETNVKKDEVSGSIEVRCTLSDITKRKLAEQTRYETEERLVLAMEASGEGVWDWDIENDRVIHSSKWYELLGLEENNQDNTLGHFMALLHPQDRDEVWIKLRQAAEGEGRFQSEHRLRCSDGRYIWVLEKGSIVDRNEAGMALRMVGIFVDISERRYAEEKQREFKKNYERMLKHQVVDQTIAAIAHDLNQPLSAAASYTNAVQNLLLNEGNTPVKAINILDEVAQQIERAGQVIHDLFKFLHSGETVIEPIDLNQMVRTVIDQLRKDSSLHGFQVVLELVQGLPDVNANIQQLEMVLTNLLRNAVEAMEEGGLITGSILVAVRTDDSGSYAHLSVQDSGPGVPEAKLQSIFSAFFSTKPHGLGMGLAISRALIESQGGRLWCQSETGKGATFHLTIPFATETTQ